MQDFLSRYFGLMTKPLVPWTRLALVALAALLGLSLTQPLWNIHMVSPQFSQGLDLNIYAHTIAGDIGQINTLNTLIGMERLDPRAFSDLGWIPFALGGLVMLTLRVVAVGDVRSLIDLAVLVTYFSIFAMIRFYYTLYLYGHALNPGATVRVEPFTPVLLGSQQISDITTWSSPQAGAWLIAAFALAVWLLTLWHMARGLRAPAAAR